MRPKLETDPYAVEEAARLLHMKPREVLGYFDVDDGRVVLTCDGQANIILTRPDAMGHPAGTVAYYPQPAVPVPAAVRSGNFPTYTTEAQLAANPEPATLDDLAAITERNGIAVPRGVQASFLETQRWVGTDPVRAYAVLRWQAAAHDCNPHQAAEKSPLAARMLTVIRAQGIAA